MATKIQMVEFTRRKDEGKSITEQTNQFYRREAF